MFARMAHFESDPGSMDEMVEGVRKSLEQGREATARGEVPEEMRGMEGVTRVLVLVDREGGEVANLVFCDTEDALRQAHEALNAMTPEGGTRRTSVGLYEVALDESMR
jgi:hypothetical protein